MVIADAVITNEGDTRERYWSVGSHDERREYVVRLVRELTEEERGRDGWIGRGGGG